MLQVVCNAQVIGSTEFLYYADAAYNSEMFYQFLCQNLPQYYYPSDKVFGGTGAPNSGAASTYGSGYCNNVPTSMYEILVGSCRMGLEYLVYATLNLSCMRAISQEQLEKAHEAAMEYEHFSLANMLATLIESKQIVPRGGEARGGEAASDQYCARIADLYRGEGTPEGWWVWLPGSMAVHCFPLQRRLLRFSKALLKPSRAVESLSGWREEVTRRSP